MKRKLKIYTVRFAAVWPIGNCLVIAARSKKEAEEIAGKTILHTKDFEVKREKLDGSKVIVYLAGEY
jgi:hypothetical protein